MPSSHTYVVVLVGYWFSKLFIISPFLVDAAQKFKIKVTGSEPTTRRELCAQTHGNQNAELRMQILAAISERACNQLMERDCESYKNQYFFFSFCDFLFTIAFVIYYTGLMRTVANWKCNEQTRVRTSNASKSPTKSAENEANAIGAATAMSAIEVATTRSEIKISTRIHRIRWWLLHSRVFARFNAAASRLAHVQFNTSISISLYCVSYTPIPIVNIENETENGADKSNKLMINIWNGES